MSFPIVTSGGGQIGTGLIYSNVVYFPNITTSSRTISWTVPEGVTRCRVRLWGGGGGGGSSAAGGGGGFALKTITGLTPGTSITVTVGSAGLSTSVGTGGTSSFGAYVSATGGRNSPSTGGAGSGGDINMNGAAGATGVIGGAAGNLFIPYTGVSTTELLSESGSFPALTLMATPVNPLDKIGTGYLFGLPSTSVVGANQYSLNVPAPGLSSFGNGAGGLGIGINQSPGTYPGGGSASVGSGGAGLVVVEY